MAETTGIRFFATAVHRSLLAIAALIAGASAAAAQELPPAPTNAPGAAAAEVVTPPASPTAPTESSVAVETPKSDTPVSDSLSASLGVTPNANLWDSCPTVTESSGTWINRGYWYSQVEAVVMQREWNRTNTILAGDSGSARLLTLGRTSPGREGSLRTTLGRFLFRDADNRDHNFEFTFLGAGEFGQNSEVFGSPFATTTVGGITINDPFLVVPFDIDQGALFSFDGAERMFVQYDSRFNSIEANYTGSTRLESDRMELMPTGQWVRRVNTGLTYQWLAGLRYFDLTENIFWRAANIQNDFDGLGIDETIDFNGEDGVYTGRTSNDLYGLQMGGGVTYEGKRFSIAALSKLGILANDISTSNDLVYTDATTGIVPTGAGFSDSNRTDTLSFLTEFSVVARYRLRPNIALRAGYHLLYVTEVALEPHQINFAPGDATVATSGDSFYHGISTGLDFYW
ncbi:MAG: BBP7 family outer membrane beta-barrel protein [Planctomycetota bacterium]